MTVDLYRIDRFTVPAAARTEFLTRIHVIDALLSAQPGCRAHRVFERRLDRGETAIITIAEWESPEAMTAARDRVAAEYHMWNGPGRPGCLLFDVPRVGGAPICPACLCGRDGSLASMKSAA